MIFYYKLVDKKTIKCSHDEAFNSNCKIKLNDYDGVETYHYMVNKVAIEREGKLNSLGI